MSTYEELLVEYREKFDREIFPLLISNELINKNTGRVYHSFQKRLDRIELQKQSIENKISQLKQHMSSGNNFEDFDKSVLFDARGVCDGGNEDDLEIGRASCRERV